MENEQAKKQCEKLDAIKNTTKNKDAQKAIDKKKQQIGKEVKK